MCIAIAQIWHTDYQELSHCNCLGMRYRDPCAMHIHVITMNTKAYCTVRNIMNPSKSPINTMMHKRGGASHPIHHAGSTPEL